MTIDSSIRVSGLLRTSGISAGIGAVLWGYKTVAILLTGEQPDHVFQIAPFFFGVSVTALVYALRDQLRRPWMLLAGLAWTATAAGAIAAIAHFVQGEDGLGDPGYLVNFVATLILFFLIGGDIRRNRLLPKWSFAPSLLAWSLLLVIPLGAVLEGVNERFLEIPLLAVSVAWAVLALATLSRSSSS